MVSDKLTSCVLKLLIGKLIIIKNVKNKPISKFIKKSLFPWLMHLRFCIKCQINVY